MSTTCTSGWWGETGHDAPCPVIPPHDHDALLDRIQHFRNITTTLAMPPFRWSISPVADQTATLTRRSPVIHIIMTTSWKARESLAHARC